MKARATRFAVLLRFSRWNRKGFAIFASLGREVRIGTLAIHICEMSSRKSSRKGMIVNLPGVFGWLTREFEGHEGKVARACLVSCPARVDADGTRGRLKIQGERYGCWLTGVPFLIENG